MDPEAGKARLCSQAAVTSDLDVLRIVLDAAARGVAL
jgi:hypothetical protein